MAKKVNVVTLGCSKNVVDSEVLMHQLDKGGWEIVHNSNDPSARVVVINTCGFIGDAKEESVETILGFVDAKGKGLIDKIYVMGCLSQRYRNELEAEIPEVDGFFGVSDLPRIVPELNVTYNESEVNRRWLTTPKHYAFLKISEGCNWGCSFCAIPLIRGKHVSRPIESLIDETTKLANQGVKELIVIAQDTTYYGFDIYGERRITQLLNSLSQIDGIEWIRLHYAYPSAFPDDLIAEINSNPKICKYIDIPLQHINTQVLKMMRRGINREQTIDLIEKIRKNIPEIAIRTTFLVGHPGETLEAYNELVDFVKDYQFDRVGAFAYSEEEGTYAAQKFTDSISNEEKTRRVDKLMEIQQMVSLELNQQRVWRTFKVIIDAVEGHYAVCRTEFDSPEVDQEVLVKLNGNNVKPGEFHTVRIVEAQEYDLFGEFV
ncbi:MAG TPA: 30S ribosomal protein S12 methylthiotransferase RimO [Bacteroidales bacterium]|nr:30S ribosomal protein S12 methylthiotransferase RimO [Bacteroidales bacterium]